MKITVRPAAENDLPALLALYGELNPDDAPLPPATAHDVWEHISRQRGRTVLVADAADTLVGTADCLVMPNLTRGGRAILFVENVVVVGTAQRRGVGRLLMDAAFHLAVAEGCYKVQLLAADDAYVHTFYKACGFKAAAQGFRRYVP